MQQGTGRVRLGRHLNNDRSSERIHCSFSYEEDVAWYGRGAAGVLGIGARHTGFVQPITSRTPAATPAFSNKGVSRRCFLCIVLAVLLVLAIPLTSTLVEMTELSKTVSGLNSSIESTEKHIADQQAELATKSSKYDVQYLAAQMGMHAATSRDTVYLTLPALGN